MKENMTAKCYVYFVRYDGLDELPRAPRIMYVCTFMQAMMLLNKYEKDILISEDIAKTDSELKHY